MKYMVKKRALYCLIATIIILSTLEIGWESKVFADAYIQDENQLPLITESASKDQQVVVSYNDDNGQLFDLKLKASEVKAISPVSNQTDIIQLESDVDVEAVLRELNNNPAVAAADYNCDLYTMEMPDDPLYSMQWQLNDMGINSVWNKVSSKNNAVVAVIDTGTSPLHEDLIGRITDGYDYVDQSTTLKDLAGHGTSVTGCVAANSNNGVGITGVNGLGNVQIAPYRIGGTYTGDTKLNLAYAIDAIRTAADREDVKVINMSFGTTTKSLVLETAVEYAVSKGKVLVAAAGNNAEKNPGEYNYPASFNGVISVAATTLDHTRASFSQYNDQVDLAAPGQNVPILTASSFNSYGVGSGTSYSSPFVSGICATLMADSPETNAKKIEVLLKDTALDIGQEGIDNEFGHGLIQMNAAYDQLHESTLIGDTNGDGIINSVDALCDLQHSVRIITIQGEGVIRGDVDKNGVINSLDALKILQYSVRIIFEF